MTIIDDILKAVNTQKWTKNEKAAFLAQIEHESMSFKRTKEMGYSPERAYQVFPSRFKNLTYAKSIYNKSGSEGLFEIMYSGKNGNINPGDGAKYIGRAWLMITGRSNYEIIENETGLKVINNPELLENAYNATLASIVWWKNNVHGKVKNWDDVTEATRLVNGAAMLGLNERQRLRDKWIKLI